MIGCLLVAGCKKTEQSVAPKPWEPTEAQPKLQSIKLWIGAEEMPAEIAVRPKEIQTGMMFRTNLDENAGMIFILPYPMRASFWMKNCTVPLSAAYIDPEGRILEIHDLQPHNTNAVMATSDVVKYVLEVNQGWFKQKNIEPGTMMRTESGSLRQTFNQ